MSRRAAVLVLAGLLLAAGAALAQRSLDSDGVRAYETARAAEEALDSAVQEGERAIRELRGLTGATEVLAAFREEAGRHEQVLSGYRVQTQRSLHEALMLLTDVVRSADSMRRQVLEQKALLAAYEAGVMAARAQATTERLRATLATARLELATAGARRPAAAPPLAAGQTVVPNLIGASLAGARRDLDAAGLRLGSATGPADGFVVKQEPLAGVRAARQSAVSVTLSGSAANVTPPSN